MAQSKCVSCNNTTFKMVQKDPTGSNYTYSFIQCAHCGGVVGVVDALNTGALLQKIIDHLDIR